MKIRLKILLLVSLFALKMTSQNQIQRASRTMEYHFNDCSSLVIQGEKATIHVAGKTQNGIDVKVTLVAKHISQSKALSDIKYIRFSSQKVNEKLILKNFYETTPNKIESNLSIIYELYIPENMTVELRNLYGSVNLQNLKGTKNIDLAFGKIEMQNILNKTQLQAKYSSINIEQIAGKLTGTLTKSDADVKNCSAGVELNMSYGKINASLTDNCETFSVAGNRTAVELYLSSTNYNLNLKTTNYKILVFSKLVNQQSYQLNNASNKHIQINTSYCPININLK